MSTSRLLREPVYAEIDLDFHTADVPETGYDRAWAQVHPAIEPYIEYGPVPRLIETAVPATIPPLSQHRAA